jgi:hypothetical protein
VLDNSAKVTGLVGDNAVDPDADQGAEITAIVNRPDNEAHARSWWARGIHRITPPEFRHEKISPGLDGHHRFPPQGKACACLLIAADGRGPFTQLYKLRSFCIKGNFHACARDFVPAPRFLTQPVKDRLIGREENGFLQHVISLQGLYGMLKERWHQIGEIRRNFDIEKQESGAIILA